MDRQQALFGLFGAGGFGREVMPFARTIAEDMEVVFVDTDLDAERLNGQSVYSEEQFWQSPHASKYFNVTVGSSSLRKRITDAALARGARPLELAAPTATFLDDNSIDEGGIFCHHTTVTSNARIGRFFHLNIYSYVAHDCVIGDFVTFAPSVCCNGNVHVGDLAYVGTGAILKHGTPEKPLVIGEGAVIGMGAVVTKDVPPHTTVVGNPARPLTKA